MSGGKMLEPHWAGCRKIVNLMPFGTQGGDDGRLKRIPPGCSDVNLTGGASSI